MMVTGRLDAYWADHLTRALDEAIRGGGDRIRLDLSGVSFVSSVGLRVLIRVYKQLQRINGALAVTNPSAAVRRVLELAGLVRFDAGTGTLGLARLLDTALELTAADAAGVVLVAESAGLIGAALRRSPARGPAAGAPFTYPEIRDWLSFTPERAHARSVALVVGVVTRGASPALAALVRPLGGSGSASGHFHAAAFSYRPLQRGLIDLGPTVGALFQDEALQGVLHLLPDDRQEACRESEFVRGACWIGPLGEIVAG